MTEAETLATQIDQGDFSMSDLQQAAALLRSQATEIERLRQLITKLHTAKGRYHTQLAACDLFDVVGLKNERPVK